MPRDKDALTGIGIRLARRVGAFALRRYVSHASTTFFVIASRSLFAIVSRALFVNLFSPYSRVAAPTSA